MQLMSSSSSCLTKAEDKWWRRSWPNTLEIHCQVSYCRISSHFLTRTGGGEAVCLWVENKWVTSESEARGQKSLVTGSVWLKPGCILTKWITTEWGMLVFVETFVGDVISTFPWHHLARDHKEGPRSFKGRQSSLPNVAWLVTWLSFLFPFFESDFSTEDRLHSAVP